MKLCVSSNVKPLFYSLGENLSSLPEYRVTLRKSKGSTPFSRNWRREGNGYGVSKDIQPLEKRGGFSRLTRIQHGLAPGECVCGSLLVPLSRFPKSIAGTGRARF